MMTPLCAIAPEMTTTYTLSSSLSWQATKLDSKFAPAWIGFGNAFAAQEETDQAISAYRTAARLFQGSHLPLLYIGKCRIHVSTKPLHNRYANCWSSCTVLF